MEEDDTLKLPDIKFTVKQTIWFNDNPFEYDESPQHFFSTELGSFNDVQSAVQCLSDKINLSDFPTFEEANQAFREHEKDCDFNIAETYLSISYKYTNITGFASYMAGLEQDLNLQPYNGLLSDYPGIKLIQSFNFKEVMLFANDHLTVGDIKDNIRIFDIVGNDPRVIDACQAITEQLINYNKELNVKREHGEEGVSL